jgi:hypothetical protein
VSSSPSYPSNPFRSFFTLLLRALPLKHTNTAHRFIPYPHPSPSLLLPPFFSQHASFFFFLLSVLLSLSLFFRIFLVSPAGTFLFLLHPRSLTAFASQVGNSFRSIPITYTTIPLLAFPSLVCTLSRPFDSSIPSDPLPLSSFTP